MHELYIVHARIVWCSCMNCILFMQELCGVHTTRPRLKLHLISFKKRWYFC